MFFLHTIRDVALSVGLLSFFVIGLTGCFSKSSIQNQGGAKASCKNGSCPPLRKGIKTMASSTLLTKARPKPGLDENLPAKFETATFALG